MNPAAPGSARPSGAGAEPQGLAAAAAEWSVTPWAWGGGGAHCSWLGLGAGFLSGREGGPQRVVGAAADRHTPASLPPSPPFCWKREVIVSPG